MSFVPIFLSSIVVIGTLVLTLWLDNLLHKKFDSMPRVGIFFVGGIFVLIGTYTFFIKPILPNTSAKSTEMPPLHSTKQVSEKMFAMPGMQGDRTKRYSVSFIHPETVRASEDTQLTFKVYDASNGNQVFVFNNFYEKLMHLIVVDRELNYFNHIHPEITKDGFTITTQFPHDGIYHLYTDFQPRGAIEQQFGFTIKVGEGDVAYVKEQHQTKDLTRIVENYEVTMQLKEPLKATKMDNAEQLITFILRDAQTKEPILTLKPYLASFGHLVMIHEETMEYLHVHPSNVKPPQPDANGGPTVDFTPMSLYAPIKPGTYRVFAQFNPDNNLFTADFTVNVE